MMTTRILTDPDQLWTFAREYSRLAGHVPSIGYMKRCLVRGFFIHGTLCGGYLLNTRPPFRYLEVIRADERPRLPFPLDDCCEYACLWKAQDVSRMAASRIYAWAGLDFYWSGKRYLLAGSLQRRIALLQKRALPFLLYRGPVDLQGQKRNAEIYCGTRATFVRAFFAGLVSRLLEGAAVGVQRAWVAG